MYISNSFANSNTFQGSKIEEIVYLSEEIHPADLYKGL